MTDRDSARVAKEQLRAELAPLDGVGGIGIGRRRGGYVVTVDVAEQTDGAQVPSTWHGVDVEVRVIGRVVPLGVAAADGRTPGGAADGPHRWGLLERDGTGTGR